MPSIIKTDAGHRAKRAPVMLPKPMPPVGRVNKTGIELTPAERKRALRGAEQINRGECLEFDSADDLIAHIMICGTTY